MNFEELLLRIEDSNLSEEDKVDLFIDDISSTLENHKLDNEQKEKVIYQLLRFTERQKNEEFLSWSLIHVIEWLDEENTVNYTNLVLASLERKPTYLVLILLNRIINAETANLDEKKRLINELKKLSKGPASNNFIKQEAIDLYERQLKELE